MRWTVLALLSALLLPAHAAAQCRLCAEGGTLTGEEAPAMPVQLELETTLDFDKLILTGPAGGVARLGPDGSRLTSGAIEALSARAMIGELLIRGEPGRSIRVTMPERIELFGPSGGSLSIQRLASDLPPSPRLDGNGRLRVRFGGELAVSGDAEGDYRGDIAITVDYL
jgi:hypothetical protein